jgi:hypothetical protein
MDFIPASTSPTSLSFILGSSDGDDWIVLLAITGGLLGFCMLLMGGQLLVQAGRMGWDNAVMNNAPMDDLLDFICRNHKYRNLKIQSSNLFQRKLARDVLEILNRNSSELTNAGLDPTTLKAELSALAKDAEAKAANPLSEQAVLAANAAGGKASDILNVIFSLLGMNHKIVQSLQQEYGIHPPRRAVAGSSSMDGIVGMGGIGGIDGGGYD